MICMAARASPKNTATYEDISWEEFMRKWNETTALNTLGVEKRKGETLSAVAAAHRIFTNSMSELPVAQYIKTNHGREEYRDSNLDYLLTTRPNERHSAAIMKKVLASNAFWYGLGAAYIGRYPNGEPQEIVPLDSKGWQYYYDEAEQQPWYAFTSGGQTRKFQPSELILVFFDTYDGKRGRGMLDLARRTVDTDERAAHTQYRFYSNGARISGVLQTDSDIGKDARNRLKQEFANYATGMDDEYKVAVLDRGLKFTSMGLSQADAQYIESRKFAVEEISRFTGIPVFMLQSGSQSYNSNEQQQLSYVQNTLLAHVIQWEQEWTNKLILEKNVRGGRYLRFNMDALLRGDYASRMSGHSKAVMYGIKTPDEVRALEEMNPLPNGLGMHPLMTKNLASLEAVIRGDT